MTDEGSPTIFIHYRRISTIAILGNIKKFTLGSEKLILEHLDLEKFLEAF